LTEGVRPLSIHGTLQAEGMLQRNALALLTPSSAARMICWRA